MSEVLKQIRNRLADARNDRFGRKRIQDLEFVVAVLEPFINKLQSPEFLERLAELEHKQWSYWINYQKRTQFGKLEQWYRQAQTPYAELTEKEKESDREWARKVLEEFDRVLKMETEK